MNSISLSTHRYYLSIYIEERTTIILKFSENNKLLLFNVFIFEELRVSGLL